MAGVALRPWELRALDQMEIARLRWLNSGEDQVVAGQPVTPRLMQALFE